MPAKGKSCALADEMHFSCNTVFPTEQKAEGSCLRLRYFGFFFLSEKNFKRPMHTETKDPSLYLCTAVSRISDTVNASHHHLRHRHDNCINVSQHALLFLSRFVELKTVFTIALSERSTTLFFPIFFCRSCPGAVHATCLPRALRPYRRQIFQEGMIIPVRFVARHRVDVDVMNAVENAFFDIRIIRFNLRISVLISCLLEPPPPLSQIAQFSVNRHAHWINCRLL